MNCKLLGRMKPIRKASTTRSGRDILKLKRDVVNCIRRWYSDRFFIYDAFGSVTDENLLESSSMPTGVITAASFWRTTHDNGLNGNDRTSTANKGRRRKAKGLRPQLRCACSPGGPPQESTGRLTKLDISGSAELQTGQITFSGHIVQAKRQERSMRGRNTAAMPFWTFSRTAGAVGKMKMRL